jgi:hypothetical protein
VPPPCVGRDCGEELQTGQWRAEKSEMDRKHEKVTAWADGVPYSGSTGGAVAAENRGHQRGRGIHAAHRREAGSGGGVELKRGQGFWSATKRGRNKWRATERW